MHLCCGCARITYLYFILNVFAGLQVSKMSILSCLGGSAESVRDMYLNRLQGTTEVCQIKISLDFQNMVNAMCLIQCIEYVCCVRIYRKWNMFVGPPTKGCHLRIFVGVCGVPARVDRNVSQRPTHWFHFIRGSQKGLIIIYISVHCVKV